MADTISEQVDKLARTDKLRRDLVSSISHDLRGPVTSMQLHVEELLYEMEEEGAHTKKEELETLYRTTQLLGRMISDLFELAKLEAKEIAPVPAVFDIEETLHDVVLKFQPLAAQKKVALKMEEHESASRVLADAYLIERAISNLLDNALRFTPEGGEVRIGTYPQEYGVSIRVSDTGPGIPAHELPNIFERFYRADTERTRKVAGTGLGLSIVKNIIEAHGSTILVTSTEGSGAIFEFSLPWAQNEPSAKQAHAHA